MHLILSGLVSIGMSSVAFAFVLVRTGTFIGTRFIGLSVRQRADGRSTVVRKSDSRSSCSLYSRIG